MICKQHLVEYLKKNKKATTFTCLSCQEVFDIPKEGFIELKMVRNVIEKDVYLMEDEKNYKFELEKSLNELDFLYNEFKLKFKEFPAVQFDRFAEIKRNIQQRKETLVSKITEISQEMIAQVALSEEAFRNKVIENKINQEIDFTMERKNLKEMFRDPYLEIEKIESYKAEQEAQIKQLEDKLTSFESMKNVLCNFTFKSSFTFTKESFGTLNLSGASQNVATCSSENNEIDIWDVNSHSVVRTFSTNTDKVFCLCVYQNSKLIIGSRDKSIKIYELASGDCLKTIDSAHSNSVFCLKVIKKDLFLSGSSDNTIKMWDINTFTCILQLIGHTGHIRCLEQLANYNICSGSNDFTIRVWDTSGNCINKLAGHTNGVLCMKLLNNGCLATGSHDCTIKLWSNLDNSKFECFKTLRGHSSWIIVIEATSQDILISCSGDKTIKIWSIDSASTLQTLAGHTGVVYCIKLNTDKQLISASDDKTLRFWDLETGLCSKMYDSESKIFDLQLCTI